MAALVGNDEGALELPGLGLVDPEIGRQFHRTANALRNVDEGAIAEHRRVERRVKIVTLRHHAAQVFFHQLRMRVHRLGNRTENHACFKQLFPEGGHHGYRIEDRIDRHTREDALLVERNTELLVGTQQFRIDFGQAFRAIGHIARRRIIRNGSEIHRREIDVSPAGCIHPDPGAVGLQPPLEQPFGLTLARRDKLHHLLVEARRQRVGHDVGDKSGLVVPGDQGINMFSHRIHPVRSRHGPGPPHCRVSGRQS